MNIFELINKNIFTLSEDIHTLMTEIGTMRSEISALSAIFQAPEQPDASGEDGVSKSK